MKRTKTYLKYKKKSDFIKWWNRNPSVEEIEECLSSENFEMFKIAYMIKYPNYDAPKIEIRYRSERRSKQKNKKPRRPK